MAYNCKQCNREYIYLLPTLQKRLPPKASLSGSSSMPWRRWILRHAARNIVKKAKARRPLNHPGWSHCSCMLTASASGHPARLRVCVSGIWRSESWPPIRYRITVSSAGSRRTTALIKSMIFFNFPPLAA